MQKETVIITPGVKPGIQLTSLGNQNKVVKCIYLVQI